MTMPSRFLRHSHRPDRLTAAVLEVAGVLTRSGCRVLDAHLLPEVRVRVDRCPPGLASWAYRPAPPGTIPVPLEHYARIGGVLVTWFAIPGGQHGRS